MGVERCTLLAPGPAATAAASASQEHASPTSLCLVVHTALLRLEYLVPRNTTDAAPLLQPQPGGGHACGWAAVAPTRASLAVRVLAMAQATPEQARPEQADAPTVTVWWPGKSNPRQLPGTLRTLDGVDGATSLHCEELPAKATEGKDEP